VTQGDIAPIRERDSVYRTIVADPPWELDGRRPINRGRDAGSRIAQLPYSTMAVDRICAMPVADLAADDCHLLLWTINARVWEAYDVVKAWGFRPSQLLTWCKPPVGIGPGGVFANTSEFIVYARRGKPEHEQRVSSTWWEWPRGGHSAKPDAFLDMVEATFPGPYLELFARRARFGWDYWGDQSLGTAELGEAA
jgi:N6-adenosine-specific RNA methylase IME4